MALVSTDSEHFHCLAFLSPVRLLDPIMDQEQISNVKERIKLLMSQLNTYKVITIILFYFFNALMFNYDTLFFNFYIISQKNIFFFIKEYLEPVQPGVGSSGATETLQSPDVGGGHTTARELFNSPSSTPHLDRSNDTHQHASTPRSESRDGGRDEDHSDVVEMVALPRARRVTSIGTLLCTFLVNDNGFPLKQSRLPGSFNSYFNRLMLSSYRNHLDY
jgi:hypothetical protein